MQVVTCALWTDFINNRPDITERLCVLMLQQREECPENPGWTLTDFQAVLLKLNVPLSETDSHAVFAHIDRHGNGDGRMQYEDFDGLVQATTAPH